MIKRVVFYFILYIFIISCQTDDDSFCNVENPTEELAWLSSEIEQRNQNITEDSKYCYILQSDYEGQTVFIFGDCNPVIDKVALVYNCAGERIGILGSRTQDIPFEIQSNGKLIWKTADFACTF